MFTEQEIAENLYLETTGNTDRRAHNRRHENMSEFWKRSFKTLDSETEEAAIRYINQTR